MMTRKRTAAWGIAIAVAGLFGGILWLSGAAHFVLFLLSIGVHDRMFPERISWEAKNAWVKCPGAIADARQWPPTPRDACEAMYLCVNEGALSELQMQALHEQIRKTAGCEQP
jgi:hypothetical protein